MKVLRVLLVSLLLSSCVSQPSVVAEGEKCEKLIGVWAGEDYYAERGIGTKWRLWRNSDSTWSIEHSATTVLGTTFVQKESGTWRCKEDTLYVHVDHIDEELVDIPNTYHIVKAEDDENILVILAGIDEIGMRFTAKRAD